MPQSYTPTSDQSPRGGCFRRLCCGWDDGGGYLLQEREGGLREEESWVVGQLKKLKHLSGPKWKNMRKDTAAQFQYSPESYALNFAGDDEDCDEHANLSHSFSTRFALIGRKGGL